MKQYRARVRFSLPDDVAQKYDAVEDTSALIAESLKWYLSYGKESMKKLERIESTLAAGVRTVKEPEAIDVKRDELDDAFDNFTIS